LEVNIGGARLCFKSLSICKLEWVKQRSDSLHGHVHLSNQKNGVMENDWMLVWMVMDIFLIKLTEIVHMMDRREIGSDLSE
jgi:hypothetical protein